MMSICMRFQCMPPMSNLGGLLEAATTSQRLAEETMELCGSTEEKSQRVEMLAQDTKSSLASLTSMSPSKFMTIVKELTNEEKRTEFSNLVKDMDDLAAESGRKSKEICDAMQQGADSLPDAIKEQALELEAGDNEPLARGLENFDDEISELEASTEGMRSMNLLTATTAGTRGFDGLVNKTGACQKVFGRMKELCASIAQISQQFTVDNANCCAQIQAGLESIQKLMKALRLAKILQRFAEVGRRLIAGFLTFTKVAWSKFGHFVEEFQAAKKLKTWVNHNTSAAGKKIKRKATGLIARIGLGS